MGNKASCIPCLNDVSTDIINSKPYSNHLIKTVTNSTYFNTKSIETLRVKNNIVKIQRQFRKYLKSGKPQFIYDFQSIHSLRSIFNTELSTIKNDLRNKERFNYPYNFEINLDDYSNRLKNISYYSLYSNNLGIVITQDLHYKGQLKNHKFHGFGEIIFSNGDKYIGEFQENTMCGIGRYNFNNTHNYYEGSFKNNSYNGLVSNYL